jgi:hypothetical protein
MIMIVVYRPCPLYALKLRFLLLFIELNFSELFVLPWLVPLCSAALRLVAAPPAIFAILLFLYYLPSRKDLAPSQKLLCAVPIPLITLCQSACVLLGILRAA